MQEVVLVVGAGQISIAIARRIGYGKKIILGDHILKNAEEMAKILIDTGFDVEVIEMNLSSRESI